MLPAAPRWRRRRWWWRAWPHQHCLARPRACMCVVPRVFGFGLHRPHCECRMEYDRDEPCSHRAVHVSVAARVQYFHSQFRTVSDSAYVLVRSLRLSHPPHTARTSPQPFSHAAMPARQPQRFLCCACLLAVVLSYVPHGFAPSLSSLPHMCCWASVALVFPGWSRTPHAPPRVSPARQRPASPAVSLVSLVHGGLSSGRRLPSV